MAIPKDNRKLKILLGFSISFLLLGILTLSLYTVLDPFIKEVLFILINNTTYSPYIIIGVGAGSLFIGFIIGIFAFREWRKNKKTIYDTFAS